MLHVSWTEWKNLFSLEIYCRTAKIQVDGLVRSYGPQRLTIYRMRPELGPPEVEEVAYPDEDLSWAARVGQLRRRDRGRRRPSAERRPERRSLRVGTGRGCVCRWPLCADARGGARLSRRRVLITGGSKGIGRAQSRRRWPSGVGASRCSRVRSRRLSRPSANCPATVTRRLHRCRGRDRVGAARPASPATCMVSCAPPPYSILSVPSAVMQWLTFAARSRSMWSARCSRSRMPAGLRASRGAVVTFSGGGATAPLPRFDAYATSKAAVARLSENLALELAGDGVRVNCISPGFVATGIHESTLAAGPVLAGADYFERTRAELERGGVPASEAAELICLLLEDDHDAPFTGKLISAQWDAWREAGLPQEARQRPGPRDAETDRRRVLHRDGRAS